MNLSRRYNTRRQHQPKKKPRYVSSLLSLSFALMVAAVTTVITTILMPTVQAWDPEDEYQNGYVIYDDAFRLGSNFIDNATATGSRTVSEVADPLGAGHGTVKQVDYTQQNGRYVIEGFSPQGIHVTAIDFVEFDITGDWDEVQFRLSGPGGSTAYEPLTNHATFTPGVWTTVTIPLTALAPPFSHFANMTWQYTGTGTPTTIHLDNVRVYKNVTVPAFSCSTDQVGGVVFYDPNMNGVRENLSVNRRENGIENFLVTAYDDFGNTYTDTTDARGRYRLSVPDGTALRIEFNDIPAFYYNTANGADSQTSVVFTTSSSNCDVDFGIQKPTFYCQNDPLMATTCFVAGDTNAAGVAASSAALVSFPYSAFGEADLNIPGDYNIPDPSKMADGDQVGSVWGLAYQRSTKRLLTTAFLKRHSSFGAQGTGGVYVFDTETNGLVYSFSISTSLGIDTGQDTRTGTCAIPSTPTENCLPANGANPSYDVDAMGEVGKRSIGDIDLSGDGQTLWVMNLIDKTLYEVPIGTTTTPPTSFTAHPIEASDLTPTCPNDDFRPFAVKFYQGLVYVGVTCTAETSQADADLHAYILSLDPVGTAGDFQPVFNFPLDAHGQVNTDGLLPKWYPWTTNGVPWVTTNTGGRVSYPQPLLSDIEFDIDGSMVLGILDRFGHQSGGNNYSNNFGDTDTYRGVGGGDILRVCNVNNSFQMESNGICPDTPVPSLFGTDTNEGPNNGEFYWGDSFPQKTGHRETGNGGLAILHGSGQVATTAMDPLFWGSGGVLWFNNTTGNEDRAYELFRGNNFSKSTGLGDLELFCNAAPLELGNRVWLDNNNNGIQDPSETPLGGVIVNLYQAGTVVATATTNATGQYFFIGQENPISQTLTIADTHYGNAPTITAGTPYEIRIDTTQSAVSTYTLTIDSQGSNDLHDSDATLFGDEAIIAVTTGSTGENDHSYDFGFRPNNLLDWGDLPDTYGTTLSNTAHLTAAVHTIVSDLYLGSLVDDETDGQPNITATGDDANGITDDEDGITFLTPIMPNQATSIEISAHVAGSIGATAQVGVWLDLNGDGDFNDASEFHTLTLTNTGSAAITDNLSFIAPAVISDTVYSRIRIASNPAEVGQVDDFVGAATTGEVEDYALMSLGNTVWFDTNNDGLLNNAETGIDNVTVTLVVAGTTTPIATTVTDANGNYLFTGLTPGDYQVIVAPSNFQTSGTLVNHLSSTGVAGDPDTDQDDQDDNGIDPTNYQTEGVSSAPITLELGDEPTTDGNGPNSNLTVDFGFYPLASIGDFVWHDLNADGIQDSGEPGIDGVTVNLYRGGTLISTTTTISGGLYLFDKLVPGDYFVEFVPPPTYIISPQDQGGLDNVDSDIDPITGRTITTTLTAGENDLTWDAGLYQLAEIGDRVWLDPNRNGIQDGGETGVDGVTVNLYQGTTLISTTATSGGGLYLFDNLMPGDYFIEFVPPVSYTVTPQDQGSDNAVDSDADRTTGRTITTNLVSGESDLTWDAGLYQAASIGDLVWYDADADGIQDGVGEPGIGGVTVQLFDSGNNLISTTTTLNDGSYQFTDLVPGDYYVQFTPPSTYTISPQDTGSDDTVDSDVDPTTRQTILTTLDPGENDPTWDLGLYISASIGDLVWFDLNQDGIQDSGEQGVPNITVELYDGAGSLISTTTTAADGTYLFDNLVPGDYYLDFIPPSGYAISPQNAGTNDNVDSDIDPATGETVTTILDPGENDLSWDAGIYALPAEIGDLVWFDINQDGIQDSGEQGVPNVTVNLYQSGLLISTTTTISDGTYLFTDLPPGDYYIEVVPPAGYGISPQDTGTNDNVDSDIDPNTGQTIPTTLDPGESDLSWDAGIYPLASIGDLVWFDTNQDGIQDSGEQGVPNVTVELYDGAGSLISTTTTAADGTYLFDNLVPGDYYLDFIPPTGYTISPQNAGTNDNVDSDIDPTTGETVITTLDPGENDLSWDTGIYAPPAEIGDLVWLDINQDGIQDSGEQGVPNVTVNLYQSGLLISTTTTISDGTYLFSNLPPGDYYIEIVPPTGYGISPQDTGTNNNVDSDIDPNTGQTIPTTLDPGESDLSWDAGIYPLAAIGDLVWFDLNQDGIQDSGELGVPNVTVELYNSAGTLISTTTTAADGTYLFDNLVPGDYYLDFIPPMGYTISPQNAGTNDNVDSDIDPATGETVPTTLDPGENDLSWDAGIYVIPAEIGDLVWFDTNRDGVQDSGEQGVSNVTVNLYQNGVLISTTTTISDGTYLFTNLPPGDYYIEIVPPAGYNISPQDQGSDDASDSDIDPVTGQTIPTTLDPGESDLTWDAGIYPVACLGNLVWYDANADGIQDSSEIGVPGVTIELYQGTTLISSTITMSDGTYLFCDLPPGDYHIQIIPPAGHDVSPQDSGTDDTVDSDIDPNTGQTIPTTLVAGENDLTWDAGVYMPPAMEMAKWAALARVVPQQQVTYTIAITNTGGIDIGPVTITDTLPTSVTVSSGIGAINPTPTSVNGQEIVWTIPTLSVGQTERFTILVDIPLAPTLTSFENKVDSVATTPVGVITKTTTASVLVDDPAVILDKRVVAPGIVNGVVTFTIRITNTGPSTMIQIPLLDTWVGPINYAGGTPPADTIAPTATGGRLAWDDLTLFFGDLAPNETITVTTVFEVRPGASNFTVDNSAMVTQAVDAFGNQTNDSDDGANISTAPTSVILSDFRADRRNDGAVRVYWKTAAEIDSFAFYVYRATTPNLDDAIEISIPILAVNAPEGYTFIDHDKPDTAYYWIKELERGEGVNYYGPVSINEEGLADIDDIMRILLPLILK